METFLGGRVALYGGDSREVLREFSDNTFDSVCTDPPYALVSIVKRFGGANAAPAKGNEAYQRASAGFMGQQWDTGEVAFDPEFWAEVLRVLKPGGHLVAFSGTRTYHRMTCAIEDSGFEIRDQLQWIYGSGFPKSHDVSKGIDRAAGAERERTPTIAMQKATPLGEISKNVRCAICGKARSSGNPCKCPRLENIAATDSAREWQGWGTALKPANEPICLARKPLSESTVAKNVLRWGTGAINVDGCRIEAADQDALAKNWDRMQSDKQSKIATALSPKEQIHLGDYKKTGRWPANVLLTVPENEYELKPFTSKEQKRELFRWLSENA